MATQAVTRAGADSTAAAAFDDFVSSRYAALTRSAYLLTGDWGRAEDVVQTALAKTWLAWGRLERHEQMDAYVRRVIVNVHASAWRRRWRTEYPTAQLPDRPAVDDAVVQSDLRDVLRRALAGLPAKQRTVLVLRHYEQMSEADVARLLGVSVGTVKSRCSRALAALRESGVPGTEQLSDEREEAP